MTRTNLLCLIYLIAIAGAELITALVTFTGLHLWSAPFTATYLFAASLGFTLADRLGPVGVVMLAGLITGAVLQVCVQMR